MAGQLSTGIYCIESKASGRRYVGSAANLPNRWMEHRRGLDNGRHHSRFLQREWNKRGADMFRFETLLYCDKENLLIYEQAFLDAWKPEYNTAPTAGSQLGFRFSDKSKKKMSEAAKRTRNFTGHTHSEETKHRISESRKGKGGGPRSPERLAKISAALKGRPVSQETRLKISATLTGTCTGRGKLCPDQVREIRKLRECGLGRFKIGKLLGIAPSTVNSVTGKHAYGWVK